jgi:hypothetical protein
MDRGINALVVREMPSALEKWGMPLLEHGLPFAGA